MPVHRRRESLSLPALALEVKTNAPLPDNVAIVSPTPRQFNFSSVLDLDGPTPRAFSFPANVQDLSHLSEPSPSTPSTSPSPFGSGSETDASQQLGLHQFQISHPNPFGTLQRTESPAAAINPFDSFDNASTGSAPVGLGHRRRSSACSSISLSLERSNGAPNGERRPKKGDEDYIKRPENAFILFRRSCCLKKNEEEAANAANGEENTQQRRQRQADLSKTISQQWRSLKPEERKYWDDLAKQRKKEHEEMYPWYVYQPTRNKEKKKGSGMSEKGEKEKMGGVGPERKKGHSRTSSRTSNGGKSVSRSRVRGAKSVSSASSYSYSSATESCDDFDAYSDSEASSLGVPMCPPPNLSTMNFSMSLSAMQMGMAGMNVDGMNANATSPPPPPMGMSPLSYIASQQQQQANVQAESMSRRSSVSSVHSPTVDSQASQATIKLPTIPSIGMGSRPGSAVAVNEHQHQQHQGEADLYSHFMTPISVYNTHGHHQQQQAQQQGYEAMGPVPEYSEVVQTQFINPFEQHQHQPAQKPQLSISPPQYPHHFSASSTPSYMSPTSATSTKSASSLASVSSASSSVSASSSNASVPINSNLLTLPLEKQHRALEMPESPEPVHAVAVHQQQQQQHVQHQQHHQAQADWDNYTLPSWAMTTLFPPSDIPGVNVGSHNPHMLMNGANGLDTDMSFMTPFTIDIPTQHGAGNGGDVDMDVSGGNGGGAGEHVLDPLFTMQFSYDDLLDPSQL